MEDRRRRTRTGCLTCRARRVKCDEQKPTCKRCHAANLECAGYEQKRQVEIPRRKRGRRPIGSATPDTGGTRDAAAVTPPHRGDEPSSSSLTLSPTPTFRPDGLPLIGLPNNPTPAQRPHARARDILAYHQYLFRTLRVIFKSEHLHFWRDRLCEEAWHNELIYNAIIALGAIHRAVLMLSQRDEVDRTKGVDTKVIALQTYTSALPGLSEQLGKGESMVLSVGVLVVFAYFECFNANLPAAFRHIGVAYHYFQEIASDEALRSSAAMAPIASALQDLELISVIMLPFPSLLDAVIDVNSFVPSPEIQPHASAGRSMHQYLLDIAAADGEIQDLIWNPLAPYFSPPSKERISIFLDRLNQWKTLNAMALSGFDECLSPPPHLTYQTIDEYPILPRPIADLSENKCLSLALYTFYHVRLFWALSLINRDDTSLELKSYFFLYQHLRVVATSMQIQQPQELACESLQISYPAMLHVAGHSCPNENWSHYVTHTLKQINPHGLFDSNAFATNLDIILTLEKSVAVMTGSKYTQQYPPPCQRVISAFFPQPNGKGYIAYYAGPEPNEDGEESTRHYPLGVASWSSETNTRGVKLDLFDIAHGQTFDTDWLKGQRAVKDWLTWAGSPEFNLDRALEDHINGTRFLPDHHKGALNGDSGTHNVQINIGY
ncbi:hypothetical protein BJX63DRAFT_430829 [Aspergillus granulosus]|uniref:Zn(2)-C6 fungal-type domain-containing protein n=1 Tax=Aspergillus granulosus TaxID=176169 RepID=A0ABR4HIK4_9EURO